MPAPRSQPDPLDEDHREEKQRDAGQYQAQPGIAWFFTVRHCRYPEAESAALLSDAPKLRDDASLSLT
ncbi:hypothetical protein [Massilia sp. DWR3-1-1]|uniref:hypothetical protein n=1 Tax=Massilia sp. DWR3-1-1 TaxID=2804559 RepID=UPI003CF42588